MTAATGQWLSAGAMEVFLLRFVQAFCSMLPNSATHVAKMFGSSAFLKDGKWCGQGHPSKWASYHGSPPCCCCPQSQGLMRKGTFQIATQSLGFSYCLWTIKWQVCGWRCKVSFDGWLMCSYEKFLSPLHQPSHGCLSFSDAEDRSWVVGGSQERTWITHLCAKPCFEDACVFSCSTWCAINGTGSPGQILAQNLQVSDLEGMAPSFLNLGPSSIKGAWKQLIMCWWRRESPQIKDFFRRGFPLLVAVFVCPNQGLAHPGSQLFKYVSKCQ